MKKAFWWNRLYLGKNHKQKHTLIRFSNIFNYKLMLTRTITYVVFIPFHLTKIWVLFVVLGQAGKYKQTNLKNYQKNTGQLRSRGVPFLNVIFSLY